jgi:hypothetical protein
MHILTIKDDQITVLTEGQQQALRAILSYAYAIIDDQTGLSDLLDDEEQADYDQMLEGATTLCNLFDVPTKE